jgi:MFS family permease
MLVSITLAGVSFALRPFMADLWHLYAISALQFMAFSGIMMLPAGRLVAIWFKKSRGRALGLTMTGNNFGGLALTPIIGAVLVVYSWQIAYYVMAGMFLAVWLYTLAFVDENVPLETDRTDESATNEKRILTPRRKPRLTGVALSDAFRMRNFYLLAVLMPIGSLAFVVLLPHLINNFTHTGVSLSVASGAVSLLAAFGMISKVAFGALGEKITNRLALMVSFSITIIGIVLMINPGSGPLVWISAAIFGLGMGSFGPLFTMLVQDNFGLRNFGAISGVLNLPSIPTLAVGPIIGGLTYDLTNTYSPVFISVAVVIAVGVLLLTLMRPPRAGR